MARPKTMGDSMSVRLPLHYELRLKRAAQRSGQTPRALTIAVMERWLDVYAPEGEHATQSS
jgi:predicted DNA-binding protein